MCDASCLVPDAWRLMLNSWWCLSIMQRSKQSLRFWKWLLLMFHRIIRLVWQAFASMARACGGMADEWTFDQLWSEVRRSHVDKKRICIHGRCLWWDLPVSQAKVATLIVSEDMRLKQTPLHKLDGNIPTYVRTYVFGYVWKYFCTT